MIIKKIYEPVYRFELLFIAGCTIKEANKTLLRQFAIAPIPPEFDNSSGITISLEEKKYPKAIRGIAYCIWVRDKKDFYSLLHEVVHLAVIVLEEKNIQVSDKVTEPFAYYLEFWFRTLWRVMNSEKKKKKKGGDKDD